MMVAILLLAADNGIGDGGGGEDDYCDDVRPCGNGAGNGGGEGGRHCTGERELDKRYVHKG